MKVYQETIQELNTIANQCDDLEVAAIIQEGLKRIDAILARTQEHTQSTESAAE